MQASQVLQHLPYSKPPVALIADKGPSCFFVHVLLEKQTLYLNTGPRTCGRVFRALGLSLAGYIRDVDAHLSNLESRLLEPAIASSRYVITGTLFYSGQLL